MKDHYFTLTLGIFLVIGALWGFWSGNEMYREELAQVDWPTTQATVAQVEVLRERSWIRDTVDYDYYYNVTYEYMVDGEVYTGFIERRNVKTREGDTFPVKYNPQLPDQSNYHLKPTRDYIWFNSGLCVVGIVLIVIAGKRYRRTKSQERCMS